LYGKTIRQIGTSLCDLDARLVSDDALSRIKMNPAAGGIIGRDNPPRSSSKAGVAKTRKTPGVKIKDVASPSQKKRKMPRASHDENSPAVTSEEEDYDNEG